MDEEKLQRLHDTLTKLGGGRKGLGTSSHYNFGGGGNDNGVPIKEGKDGQIFREDGLPVNALYANFVKQGSYKKQESKLKYGDGRAIKRNFDDCTPDLTEREKEGDDSDSSDRSTKSSKRRKKEKKRALKKAEKLEAKKKAKLEAKKKAKLEEKRRVKLEAKKKAKVKEGPSGKESISKSNDEIVDVKKKDSKMKKSKKEKKDKKRKEKS